MEIEKKINVNEMPKSLMEDTVKKYLELEKKKTETLIVEAKDELKKLNEQILEILSLQEKGPGLINVGCIITAIITGLFFGFSFFPLSVWGKILTIIIESIIVYFVASEIKGCLPGRKEFKENGISNELQKEYDDLNKQSKDICNQIVNAKKHIALCDRLLSSRNVLAEFDLDSLNFMNTVEDNSFSDTVDYASIHFDSSIDESSFVQEKQQKLVKKM